MQKDLLELRIKCKEIRKEQGVSINKIVDETNVSRSTVEAFFGNNDTRQFRYETIKPIVKYLMQFDVPAEKVDVPLPTPDMIEMYRAIVDIKNKEITHLADELKHERKWKVIFCATLIAVLICILGAVIADATIRGYGWIR